MKPFHLESSMRTLSGVFYPTGHVVLMFPTEQAAREAGHRLEENGFADVVYFITPADFQREITPATGDDVALPSAGSEGDTVRRFSELAQAGQYGLMIHAPRADDSNRVMELLKDAPISYGQKYRHLVIEDLVV